MTPKTGRPPVGDTSKDKGYRLRISNTEIEKLDYCCKVLGLTKADIIRQGIDSMYAQAKKKAQE